ncbi:hypothetical protein R1sor_015481 [Riccia sorocarpa]|uniref:Bifunctional inhibitor/plant lipid transfer protein/seed storage helical domain-containing protein n=1 Tax=Riccia sorocarpa TaxID=122646 RepID=A0ABD3HFD5_9MARC
MAINRVAAIPHHLHGNSSNGPILRGEKLPKQLASLSRPCASAVSGNRPSAPSGACCTAVRKADVDCVCQAYTRGQIPKSVNKNLVLGLVKQCKKSIPKNYKCGAPVANPLASSNLAILPENVNVSCDACEESDSKGFAEFQETSTRRGAMEWS